MVRYKMLGRDVNSFPIQYRTWVVNDQPDFTGEFYTGLKSGNDDFVDVSATEIQDGYAIVDFSLPLHQTWHMIEKTLPAVACNSQLAIIDGYVYLFGGQNSDVILRAETKNPADWIDTGARLPNNLGGSQLAIVDGYIYLFGGQIDRTATDAIYRAPLTNPLDWVDTGANLPTGLHNSQLGWAGERLYLFGGCTNTGAVNNIFTTHISNPLIWSDTGSTLPGPLYGSHLAVINNSFYLFGGSSDGVTALNVIYKATLAAPTIFSNVGTLPISAFFGQFFTYGNFGYMIVPAGVNNIEPFTLLMRCDLSDPLTWELFNNIDGNAIQSQVAIIYDRIFMFGGNGSSLIFTHDLQLKFPFTPNSFSQIYANITRTQYQSASNPVDVIKVIGFPYWKTDYLW